VKHKNANEKSDDYEKTHSAVRKEKSDDCEKTHDQNPNLMLIHSRRNPFDEYLARYLQLSQPGPPNPNSLE
jgi:hypothetical protein